MPLEASGGVKQQPLGSPPTDLHDKSIKEEPLAPSDLIDNKTDVLAEEEIYSDKEGLPWSEGHCMCVGGLLPQHIRNLISTV